MEVKVTAEYGFEEAIVGLGLSYGIEDMERLIKVATRLSNRDGGHNKFLESIQVWLDINAPRYWWQEFDTYRVGTTKQSESTIHTIMKKPITQDNFEGPVLGSMIEFLNDKIEEYKIGKKNEDARRWRDAFLSVKNNLPEGFLQRRIVNTNYKVLRNMIWQRRYHMLNQWHHFIKVLKSELEYSDILFKGWET
jgi:hypothetical protein